MYHDNVRPIGVKGTHPDCKICSFDPYYSNEITMDLLLRRTPFDEIARYREHIPPFTREELCLHAEHCDMEAVPDDYIVNPDAYEHGEVKREINLKMWRLNHDLAELKAADAEAKRKGRGVNSHEKKT